MKFLPNTIYNIVLSDVVPGDVYSDKNIVQNLFIYFRNNSLFRWQDANNDCEDRANAISMLLDEWNIPNYKAWAFGGNSLINAEGTLINNWKYHVASVIPVKEGDAINFYVIDPSTLEHSDTILNWASRITEIPFCHYLVKWNYYYIFPHKNIKKENWHKRNRQNYKWTIQGLSGINGVTKIGKAQVCFNKKRIKKTELRFRQHLQNPPEFLKKVYSICH